MASRWSINDPVSNLAEYNEDSYEVDDDENDEIVYKDKYDDDNSNLDNYTYVVERPTHANSRYYPLKKKVTHGVKSITSSNQSLMPADSISQANPVLQSKMNKEELAQARIVKRQATASLANRVVVGMTIQIHITDLLKMVSPAMRVELRKAFIGKDDISSEPMQISNLAKQGSEIPQATVAYIAGDINNVKFNNRILNTGSNINMIDRNFFDSLGFNIDQEARYMIKGAGMKTLPIGEKKGIPVSVGNVTNTGNFLVIENLHYPIVLGML